MKSYQIGRAEQRVKSETKVEFRYRKVDALNDSADIWQKRFVFWMNAQGVVLCKARTEHKKMKNRINGRL